MRAYLGALLFAMATGAFGQALDLAQPDARVEERLKGLAEELRCLVCQNQTIAESSAPLALDLRNQIRAQIARGRSDDEIRAYMVERYGDFVLYRPPFKASTVLLWLGPFALLALGAAIYWVVVRRRRGVAPEPVKGARRAQLEALLEASAEESARAPRP